MYSRILYKDTTGTKGTKGSLDPRMNYGTSRVLTGPRVTVYMGTGAVCETRPRIPHAARGVTIEEFTLSHTLLTPIRVIWHL